MAGEEVEPPKDTKKSPPFLYDSRQISLDHKFQKVTKNDA